VNRLLKRLRVAIEQDQLFAPAETVVVGVSGGPDSLCLLHLLCELRAQAESPTEAGWHLQLHVAHLHHGLRGAEADADAAFVRDLAAGWGLPVHVEHADVPALAEEHGLAVEEAARRARYAFLARVAGDVGAYTVAVGHNADDQSETVLMHFVRGSGLAGLRGMLPCTPIADYRLLGLDSEDPVPGIRLVRPLLTIPRADIEAHCEYHRLEPRFDRSNLDKTYFRNWLRYEVIPLLEQHNPNLREVLRRAGHVIAGDYTLLRSVLEESWPTVVVEEKPLCGTTGRGEGTSEQQRIVLDLAAWQALPVSLQRSILREAVQRLRRTLRDIGFVHIEDAARVARRGIVGSQATLPQGLMLTVGYRQLVLAPADAEPSLPDWPLLPPGTGPVQVQVPGDTPLPHSNWRLQAEVLSREDLPAEWEANADPWRAFLDLESVGLQPCLRTRQAGDRFKPLGMAGHSVKLSALLTNLKVPRVARDRLPLLTTDWGLAWVCGQRLDRRACIRKATQHALHLRFVLRSPDPQVDIP
jgi:tRNA(Ile)-lysidine synthase